MRKRARGGEQRGEVPGRQTTLGRLRAELDLDENLHGQRHGEEIHPAETVEEKVSLSERFGLWLSFYPFDQEHYLDICRAWLREYGVPAMDEALRQEALQWALSRGARNGRVAWQFARDTAGRRAGEGA